MNELSRIKTRYRSRPVDRIMQGDIFEDVPIPSWVILDGQIVVKRKKSITLDFGIVVSQDCDLEQDFRNWNKRKKILSRDKILPSILVCAAYPSEKLKLGTHCGEDVKMVDWIQEKKSGDLENNNHARFHFLKESTEYDKKTYGISIPSLAIDFKHFYTLPIEAAYDLYASEHYLGSINELFREELSHRFSSYLGRIGVPPLDKCPPCGEDEIFQ